MKIIGSLIVAAVFFTIPVAQAQTPAATDKPCDCDQLNTKLANTQKTLQDWPNIARYHDANASVQPPTKDEKRVVFMGDSITDAWVRPQFGGFFPGKPYLDRGISGQTTPQMLVRMFPDVIDLKPAAVIILAGTNDSSRNTGPMTPTMIEENLQAMTELAQAHGIKVVLCSILPIADYGPNKMSEGRPPADILKINTWMKAYAAKAHAIYADYFSATVDGAGSLKPGISRDGLHPNADGYKLMVPVAEAALAKALQ